MSEQLVSVIMSVYNEKEEWLRKSIESILGQTYSCLQFVIVLDNPDNRQAKHILDEYQKQDSRVEVYTNEKNMGLVASLNRALTFVQGDYVARMDADDIALPERLEKELHFMEKKNADMVAASVQMMDEGEREIPMSPMGEFCAEDFAAMMKVGNVAPHPTWLLKKEMYDVLGGYREAKYCEDYDFLLRALQQGFCCCKTADVVLRYRVRDNGISKSYVLEQKEKLTFLRKAYAGGKPIAAIDVEEMNRKYSAYSDKEKKKFQRADENMQEFARQFAMGSYGRCVGLILANGLTNGYFRKLFRENMQGFFARRKRSRQ